MRTVINSLAVVGCVVAMAFTLALYIGMMSDAFSGGNGMTIVFLQLWGAIGGLIALVFGFAGRIMDRRASRPLSRLANVSILIGLLSNAMIFALPFLFG